jgi:metallo-beta-lactamase family protein
MFYLSLLRKENRIPAFPMFLNSPMAVKASDLFCKYLDQHKLSMQDCAAISDVVRNVHSVEESKELNRKKGPMLIISASGMITGGRVLHHLKEFATDPKNMILLTGYQAAGTRGESLERGARELKMLGEYIPVKAEVKMLDNMSAHADYQEIIEWFKMSQMNPKKVFITHGEPSASDELRRRLRDRFGWKCVVPELNEAFELD